MVATLFWLTLGLLVYIYLGYPAVAATLARLRPRPVRRLPIRPAMTVLVIAHDEAARIAGRLENCLALRYPRDRLSVVLASDGSTDGTPIVAKAFENRGVTVIDFPIRRGKPAVLTDVLPTCPGDVVVLADARQRFDPDALTALVESFADETVGAVSGELVLRGNASAVGQGVGFYWRYEKLIRRSESRFDSTVGATGAICAVRRRLAVPIPPDTLLDDVYLPLAIVRQGYRVVFEPTALAFDDAPTTPRQEFTRKARTIAGTVQLLARERWLWNPRQNRLWFQTISHKALRLTSPFLLIVLAAATVALAFEHPFYRLTLFLQGAFCVTALAPVLLRGASPRLFAVPYAFLLLNATTVAGLVRYFTRTQTVTWRKA